MDKVGYTVTWIASNGATVSRFFKTIEGAIAYQRSVYRDSTLRPVARENKLILGE